MTGEPYITALGESTRLKLRATRLLAEGGEDLRYQAAVVFHEAYRAEARALRALNNPPLETQLRSVLEQCGCVLEGFDITSAHLLWGQVLNIAGRLPRKVAGPLMDRLRLRSMAESRRALDAQVHAPKELLANPLAFGMMVARDAPTRRRAGAFVHHFLGEFPGDAYWWMAHSLIAQNYDPPDAWKSIQCARELMPENPAYEMAMTLVALSQPDDRKRAHVALAHDSLVAAVRPQAAVCFGVALAASIIAIETSERDFWRRAREAADLGERIVRVASLEASVFRFLSLAAGEGLAGREITTNLFFRAGLSLPELAQDPVSVIREISPQLVPQYFVAAA